MDKKEVKTPVVEERYKLSICIPVYNTKQELLEDCLESIKYCGLENRKNEFEIVVIDDGSTEIDPTKIVEEFKKNNPGYNIDCFKHAKNEGLLEARRSGVFCSKGHYIFNLDSDDFLEQGMLGELLDKVYEKDYDLIQTEFIDLIPNDKVKHLPIARIDDKCTNEKQSLLRYFAVNECIPGYIWGKLIKRSVYVNAFEYIPYTNITFNEDFLQLWFICLVAKSILSVPEYTTYYYRRDTGMTNVGNGEMTPKRFDMYMTYAKVMSIINAKNAKTEELKNWINQRHTTLLLQIYSSIIVSVKDEDLKTYINTFKKTFGEETVTAIHKLFNSLKEKDANFKEKVKDKNIDIEEKTE